MKNSIKNARRTTAKVFSMLIALLILLSSSFAVYVWFQYGAIPAASVSDTRNSGMEVHFIDVGQGDSQLLICDDEAMLIDAGEAFAGDIVVNYIKGLGVNQLKYVVATHPHSDHIGGIPKVLDAFETGALIAPDVTHNTSTFERMLDAVERNGLEIITTGPFEVFSLGGAEITVISPEGKEYSDLNNYSIVMKAQYKDNSFLFTGDAEKQAEKEMLESGFNLKTDVLNVAHHGSNSSTTKEFLDAVSPSSAVISCGFNNDYNHPSEAVIKRLTNKDISIYRTDKDGTIIAKSDGSSIEFLTEKD